MRYNGTNFNVDSVTKRSEDDYVKFASTRYPHLSEAQVREIHQLATKEKAAAGKKETKASDTPPGGAEKEKAAAGKK